MEGESKSSAAVDTVSMSIAMHTELIAGVRSSNVTTKLHAVASIMIDGVTIVALDGILPNAGGCSMTQLGADGAMGSRIGQTGSSEEQSYAGMRSAREWTSENCIDVDGIGFCSIASGVVGKDGITASIRTSIFLRHGGLDDDLLS